MVKCPSWSVSSLQHPRIRTDNDEPKKLKTPSCILLLPLTTIHPWDLIMLSVFRINILQSWSLLPHAPINQMCDASAVFFFSLVILDICLVTVLSLHLLALSGWTKNMWPYSHALMGCWRPSLSWWLHVPSSWETESLQCVMKTAVIAELTADG